MHTLETHHETILREHQRLVEVAQESVRRANQLGEYLYSISPAEHQAGGRPVLTITYETVGASGNHAGGTVATVIGFTPQEAVDLALDFRPLVPGYHERTPLFTRADRDALLDPQSRPATPRRGRGRRRRKTEAVGPVILGSPPYPPGVASRAVKDVIERALVEALPGTAEVIARRVGWDRARTYAHLNSLRRRGLIAGRLSRPGEERLGYQKGGYPATWFHATERTVKHFGMLPREPVGLTEGA